MRVVIQATVPDELANKLLQHIRDFDTEHADCHFSIMLQTGRDVPIAEMIEQMQIDPALDVFQVFERLSNKHGS